MTTKNDKTWFFVQNFVLLWCNLCNKIPKDRIWRPSFLPPTPTLSYSTLNDSEFKQTFIRKQVKFTYIAKPAIANTKNFIKATNSENNITKNFTIKDLNSTFNDIDNPFSLFHLNINSLSFHFYGLGSLISKSKNDFQITGISETRLRKLRKAISNIQFENYNIEHVPTESVNRGVLLYIKKALNYKLRPEVVIYKKRNWSLFLLKQSKGTPKTW